MKDGEESLSCDLSRLAVVLMLAAGAGSAVAQSSIDAAMKFVAAGKLKDAESMLRDLEKADPRNPEVQYRLGLVLLKQGKLEDALHSLESSAKLDPKFPFVWSALALVH